MGCLGVVWKEQIELLLQLDRQKKTLTGSLVCVCGKVEVWGWGGGVCLHYL